MTTNITVAQFAITIGDSEKNLARGIDTIEQAAAANSSLIQLPELWISGYDLKNCETHSQMTQQYTRLLQDLADKYYLAIGGSYITSREGKFFNSYLLILPGKSTPRQYDKTHLFQLLDEKSYFTAGSGLTVVDLDWGKVGLAICYDVRFPEIVRAYAHRGIDCLLVAAQWGKNRSDHWRTLIRARAIENQIFIAAANANGQIYENELAGYSIVLDPWGNPVHEAGSNDPEVFTVSVDLSEIERVRQLVPSREDQRSQLYRQWADDIHQ